MQSLDIKSLQEFYRKQGGTVRSVIEWVLDRMDRGDPGVWTARVSAKNLLDQADHLDATGPTDSPLFGVPYSVKDNIDVSGMKTTAGCPAFQRMAGKDAAVVSALRKAGALVVGKNSMDQFATGLVGIRSDPVPTNPFDPTRIPGGSSSGSAVAVASGMVTFALASDTGGSGRVPAAINGIVGWKPAPSSVSTNGLVYANRTFDCVPVFARTVDDALTVVDVLPIKSGLEAALPCIPEGWMASGDGGTKVLAAPDPDSASFLGDKDCREAFSQALTGARTAGFEIRFIEFEALGHLGEMVFQSALLVERWNSIGAFVSENRDSVNLAVAQIVADAERWSASDVFEALYELQVRRAAAVDILAGADALLVPTVPTVPTIADVELDPIGANHQMGTYTYFANLLDLVACAFPAGSRADGAPFGVCLLGPQEAEHMVRVMARQLSGRLASSGKDRGLDVGVLSTQA